MIIHRRNQRPWSRNSSYPDLVQHCQNLAHHLFALGRKNKFLLRHHELPALQLMGQQLSQQKQGQTAQACLCTRAHEVLSHQLWINRLQRAAHSPRRLQHPCLTGQSASRVTSAFEGAMVL